MPSLKAIRRRITSVKNTQKITKAMKLVAAARLRKAQQRAQELRPYARKVTEVLSNVAAAVGDLGDQTPPLLQEREVKNVMLVVLTSDRGLAGAYNANVQRAADRRIRELQDELPDGGQVVIATIGRKGRDYLRRRKFDITHDFTAAYEGGAARASEIARQLISDFEEQKVDRVELIFTEFKSAISQKVIVDQLMPVKPAPGAEGGSDFIYEPDRGALLERLLPMYVETMTYRALLESYASEHGARMTAMDNATKNAKEMIGSLTLQYNRARQAAITKELMEIIGGAEALKG
jgi:F-type H+-transporting ATPase subunit gamma